MYCKNCGQQIIENNKFCHKCGQVINVQGSPTSKPPLQKTNKKRRKGSPLRIIAIIVLIISTVFITGIFIISANRDYNPNDSKLDKPTATPAHQNLSNANTGELNLGDSTHITSEDISTGGGTLTIDEGELAGFSIGVQEDAFDNTVKFDISTSPITSHDFGDNFSPASPLITIDNGELFTDKPMMVTIPIKKQDDEFAMAFFYDEDTQTLQPMPLLSLTNTELVTMTRHFTGVVVSKIKKDKLTGVYDTGFVPRVNDFQITNYGSYIKPKGFCAGQCIAMAYYFEKGGINQGNSLYGRFDNNNINKTPNFEYDDATAIRLVTALQVENEILWDSPTKTLDKLQYTDGVDDTMTYFATLYAIMIYKQPQIMVVTWVDKISHLDQYAHAILAYKITDDTIYIADPNHPGNTTKRITLTRDESGNIEFDKYTSGGDDYNQVGYYGLYAMMDESKTIGLWREVLDGSPTMGISSSSYYSTAPDITIEVAVDIDDQGNYIAKPLTKGFVLTEEMTVKLGLTSGKNLLCRVTGAKEKAKVELYIGTTHIGDITDKFTSHTIAGGVNDIGVYYMINNEHVNFYRYDLTYNKISPILTATPSQVEIDEVVSLKVDFEDSKSTYEWNFGDGQNESITGSSSKTHTYKDAGTYIISVDIYDQNSKHLGNAKATVTVIEPLVTPTPSATPEVTPEPSPTDDYSYLHGRWTASSGVLFDRITWNTWSWVQVLEIYADGTCYYSLQTFIIYEHDPDMIPVPTMPPYDGIGGTMWENESKNGEWGIYDRGEMDLGSLGGIEFKDNTGGYIGYNEDGKLIFNSTIFTKS